MRSVFKSKARARPVARNLRKRTNVLAVVAIENSTANRATVGRVVARGAGRVRATRRITFVLADLEEVQAAPSRG